MTIKFPPPPDMGRDNQKLNRWLIELQSILNNQGLIDPNSIPGLPGNYQQTGNNTIDIANLTDIVNALGAIVAVNVVDIAALQARNSVLSGIIAPVVGLGVDGDWYADTVTGTVYVKVLGAWTVV
jgi:hypothetical protein